MLFFSSFHDALPELSNCKHQVAMQFLRSLCKCLCRLIGFRPLAAWILDAFVDQSSMCQI